MEKQGDPAATGSPCPWYSTRPPHGRGARGLSSASPRRIGAPSRAIIVADRRVDLSLKRWFTIQVHSNEAPTTVSSRPILGVRGDGEWWAAAHSKLSASQSRSVWKPQPHRPALLT